MRVRYVCRVPYPRCWCLCSVRHLAGCKPMRPVCLDQRPLKASPLPLSVATRLSILLPSRPARPRDLQRTRRHDLPFPCLCLYRRRFPVRQLSRRPTRNASHTTARELIGEQHLVVRVARGEYEGLALSLCIWALGGFSCRSARRLGLRFFEKLPKRSASILRYCGCAQRGVPLCILAFTCSTPSSYSQGRDKIRASAA